MNTQIVTVSFKGQLPSAMPKMTLMILLKIVQEMIDQKQGRINGTILIPIIKTIEI